MDDRLSKRRMTENEATFRQHNERVQRGFEEIKQIAAEDGQQELVQEIDDPLQFYCECADENCEQRVALTLSEYKDRHTQRDHFVLVPGHEVSSIERVTHTEPNYLVVQKFIDPPEDPGDLHATTLQSS